MFDQAIDGILSIDLEGGLPRPRATTTAVQSKQTCSLCGKAGHSDTAHLHADTALIQIQRELAEVRRATIAVEQWIKVASGLIVRDRDTRANLSMRVKTFDRRHGISVGE